MDADAFSEDVVMIFTLQFVRPIRTVQ
jgi:hypothetical protein